VLLLIVMTGVIVNQSCQQPGMTTSVPPTPTSETAVALVTEATAISPTATSVVPTDTAAPTVLPTATLSPTVSTPPTDTPPVPPKTAVGLQVLDEGLTENTYLLNGRDVELFDIGDDLVVYGEPNPGTELAVALLKVIGKSQNALTAQAILKHPDVEIRTNMRVDGELAHLSESQLIPVFDYVVGYLLRPTRVRLRPGHELAVGAQLQVLEYERIGGEIIDALRTDTVMQITDIGASGAVAAVELVAGEWPVTGTVVSLMEMTAPTPLPTDTSISLPIPSPTAMPQPTATATAPIAPELTYPCEAEIVSPRGIVPVTIVFRQRPGEGNQGTESYQLGDRVIIKQIEESGKWYLIAELGGRERGWAYYDNFTGCVSSTE
jgi:hypothetical protein